MLKLLTCEKLPPNIEQFIAKVRTFFPNVIDLKHVTSNTGQGYHGSLQAIATNLDFQRIGTMHQAGSDSLITSAVYFKVKENTPTSSMKSSTASCLVSTTTIGMVVPHAVL